MRKSKLKKLLAVTLAAVSLSTLHVLNADAAWVKDSNGWWNTEGNSWSIGWRFIENEWYYFDSQGYMKTGWILDGGKWYYLNADGAMAKNTTIDGYKIGADGAWIENEEENALQTNTEKENTSVTDNNNSEVVKDLTMEALINSLKDKGYDPQVKDAEKGFLAGTRKIINIGDEKLEVYTYDSNDAMDKDAKLIALDGFMYDDKDLRWDSYPHFYKNSNFIIQYIGKNYKTLCDLKNIIGDQFIGMDISSKLSESEDLRLMAYNHLSDKQKEQLDDGWKSAQLCKLTDIDEKGVKKEQYVVSFKKKEKAYLDDGPTIYLDVNTFDFLGFGLID